MLKLAFALAASLALANLPAAHAQDAPEARLHPMPDYPHVLGVRGRQGV